MEEADKEGDRLIRLVLVVMDASRKDLGTTYSVLNEVIIPAVGDPGRILMALNQADIAMKHSRHWDYASNHPDETLQAFLGEQVQSVRERIPILEGLNDDRASFAHNDGEMDYGACVEGDFFETLGSMIGDEAEAGADLGGMLLGLPGRLLGSVIGGAVGTVGGYIIGVLNFLEDLF